MSLKVVFYLNPVKPVSSTVATSSQKLQQVNDFSFIIIFKKNQKLLYQISTFLDFTKCIAIKIQSLELSK